MVEDIAPFERFWVPSGDSAIRAVYHGFLERLQKDGPGRDIERCVSDRDLLLHVPGRDCFLNHRFLEVGVLR